MNKNKNISVGITVVIILAALWFIYYQIKGDSIPTAPPQMSYYTTDEGKSFFAEDQMHEIPFKKDGADAVRAWRYTCGDSKDMKLGYLERYTPEFQKQAAQAKAANTPMDPMIIVEQGDSIYEVKRPGANNRWVKKDSAAGQAVIKPSCNNAIWQSPPTGTKPGDKLS
jgi:hypothetical protein